MAETATAASKTLEELEVEITCLVCQGHYREAKLLPCMHYYCKVCIEELARCTQGRPFPCPECRKDTALPSGSAEELKGAFFVERMKDLYTKMSKAEGKGETVCEMCTSGGEATAFCRECAMFCCTGCSSSHSNPSKKHHVLVLKKENDGVVDPNQLCQEHNDPMTVFCFTCRSVVCRDCIIMCHSGHNFNVLKKCALEKRREICNSLVPLRKVQLDITNADKNLCENEGQIDKQGEAIQQSIHELFSQLKSLLEQQEAELLSVSTALVREKKDALAAQRKGLQMAQAEIESLVEFVEQNLENSSDQELMGTSAQLQTKIEEEEKRHHQLFLNTVSTADMVCDLPSVDVIPKKIGKVTCQSTVFQTTKICDLYRPASSTLYVPSFKEITIPALQSLADPTVSVQTEVTQKGVGVYDITYTPKVRGWHDLTIKVDGRDIVGSPFRVFVKIHPSQIRQVVRTISPVSQPMGITFNSNKQLVVAECSSKHIAVFSRDGSRLQTIESEDIKSPRGVAVGPEGTFFVTCNVTTGSEYSCLLKLTYLGQTLKLVLLDNPFCVRMIRNKVYACVRGAVKIFDTDCVEVSSLTTDRCTQPYDVAEGNDSIYVVGNSALGVIAKFSYDGQFQEIFQQNLLRPRCICINSDGYIFVTLCGSITCVFVFHPNGSTITSFGLQESVLRSPTGIAVDEDGFVYVCDTNSNQVVVF